MVLIQHTVQNEKLHYRQLYYDWSFGDTTEMQAKTEIAVTALKTSLLCLISLLGLLGH